MALSAHETNRRAAVKKLTKDLSTAKKLATAANKAATSANKAVDKLSAQLEKKQAAA